MDHEIQLALAGLPLEKAARFWRPATAVRVRGSGGGVLPSSMQVWIVRLE